jgi:hypothetical protein
MRAWFSGLPEEEIRNFEMVENTWQSLGLCLMALCPNSKFSRYERGVLCLLMGSTS